MAVTYRPRRGHRTATRLAAALAGALLLSVATAAPASAHGLGGPAPTDQVVTVDGTRPAIPGVSVRIIDLGTRVELTNRGDASVVVIGYDREPYLRVGPDGVWVNRRSPATFLNRFATPTAAAPAALDATAPPEWDRMSASPIARWHDHRAHWMGRGAAHDVPWAIPIRVDGASARIVGRLDTLAAPAPWPWLVGAAGLAVAIALLAGLRRWPAVLAIALVVVIVSETVHTIGAWGVWTAGPGRRLLGAAPSILAIALAAAALGVLIARRRAPDGATPLVLVAGLFIALAGGVADLGSLTHAIVPSTLDAGLTRLTVAIALGGGIGLAVGAARHLRPPVPAPDAPVGVGG